MVTDVATGKQRGSYPLPGEPLTAQRLMRISHGNIAGVVGTTAVMRPDPCSSKQAFRKTTRVPVG